MPRAKQCSYTEGRRRCGFPGEGTPALCKAHKIALAEAARPRRPAEIVSESVDNLLAGKRINIADTIDAVGQLLGEWRGNAMGSGFYPGNQPGGYPGHDARRAAPPPPDPEVIARVHARQVLGFGPSDKLTEAILKKRHHELVRKHHPDRGGSVDRMAEINNAVDILLASL